MCVCMHAMNHVLNDKRRREWIVSMRHSTHSFGLGIFSYFLMICVNWYTTFTACHMLKIASALYDHQCRDLGLLSSITQSNGLNPSTSSVLAQKMKLLYLLFPRHFCKWSLYRRLLYLSPAWVPIKWIIIKSTVSGCSIARCQSVAPWLHWLDLPLYHKENKYRFCGNLNLLRVLQFPAGVKKSNNILAWMWIN